MIPLRNHSHYSLLTSVSRNEQIVAKCKEYGYTSCGITDISTISGVVNFIQACKAENIKAIVGTEIVLTNGCSLTLICRNKNAWSQLLHVISKANDEENFNIVARLPTDKLLSMINADDFICIDGYVGSYLFDKLFPDKNRIFDASDIDSIFGCLSDDPSGVVHTHVDMMKSIFKNYYLEINNNDNSSFPIATAMSKILSESVEDNLIPDTSSFYPDRKDVVDHRVLICTKLKTTLKKLNSVIEESRDLESLRFIRSSNFYIKSKEYLGERYSEKELNNLSSISDLCEEIDILSNPKLPHFECPDGKTEIEYLKDLCRTGWKTLINTKVDKSLHTVYKDRVLRELKVIEDAGLCGYFLIVADYVNHFRNKGVLVGPGRGSAAGSLICYLIRITLVDPIKYDLLFERFYSAGRAGSLPDIDMDFPPENREEVIEYLKQKYGDSRVCQMLTFGRLAGRSIIKEILRVNESCSYEQMNKITESIPNEAAISDLLEEMDEPSVIRWALENDKDSLIDYCWIGSDGSLEGEYAKVFEQAMRMEGIFKTQGKHAAGVVIASYELENICPMIKSKGHDKVAGMEMGDLEATGCVKFDILGVSSLQKISNVVKEING